MKRITLSLLALLSVAALKAQNTTTVSFESDEGFTTGAINGQEMWGSQIDSLILVSSNRASDGSNSLFLEERQNVYNDQNGNELNVGAYSPNYTIAGQEPDTVSSTTSDNIVVSMDFYVEEPVTTLGERTNFTISVQTPTAELVTSRIILTSNGNIAVLGEDQNGDLAFSQAGTYSLDVWQTLEFEYNFANDEIVYSLDGQQIATTTVFAGEAVENFAITSSDGDTSLNIDNIVINPTLSNENFEAVNFTHYQSNGQLSVEANMPMQNVKLINLLGQEVSTKELNGQTEGSISLTNLADGMYIAKVQIAGETKSFKFVK